MLSKDEFEAYLTPEEKADIRDCLAGGVGDYDNPTYYSPEARRDHTKSLRSHIRNAHINARAQRAAMASPRMRYTPVRGRPLFTIGDRVSLSFKKLDPNLRPRSSRTRQSRKFLAQQPLPLELPDEATNVIAGYTLDSFEAGVELHLVCPGEKHNHWETKLTREQPLEHPAVDPRPAIPATPRRRVVPRSVEVGLKNDHEHEDENAAAG